MSTAIQRAFSLTTSTKRPFAVFSCYRLLALLFLLCALLLAPSLSQAAITSITPVTWNVVGLDSNSPQSGPNRFPVGARVCSTTALNDYPVSLVWESANIYINLSSGTPGTVLIDIPANGCADAYFEVEVTRTSLAFETARKYYITDGTLQTPRPCELYVKQLVSQARNGITNLEFGTSTASLTSVPAGGSFSLIKGNTYFIRMSSFTAPGGYEQLETFSTLPNTIFQVLSVSTTYTADTTTNVSSPNDMLYGDACYWEEDPDSPNYLSCNGDGKIGGTMTITYEVKIIDVAGGVNPINSLIYDLSGASYHYNSDYDSGSRTVYLVDPATVYIDKTFAPDPIAANGSSTLTFTIKNPNYGPVSGLEFTDIFPSTSDLPPAPDNMKIANLTYSNSCGGTLSDQNDGSIDTSDTGIKLVGGTVPGLGACVVKVNVTAPVEGTYTNTSLNLWAGGVDTTDNASDTLLIDNNAFPKPSPPSSCPGSEVELARWSMDNTTTAPPVYSFIKTTSPSVASAVASYSGSGTQTINTADPGGIDYSWNVQEGWPVATTDYSGTPYIKFAIDTSNFGGLQMVFDYRMSPSSSWGGTNYIYVDSSDDDATYTSTPASPSISATKGFWQTNNTIAMPVTGDTTTYIRIKAAGSASNKTEDFALNNVIFKGCPVVITTPPNLSKSFTPTTVATTGTSTLTFTVTNPNAAPALAITDIKFTDTLPTGLTVAPGTSTQCGGTLTLTAPNLISFAGGTLAAPIFPATSTTCNITATVATTIAGIFDNTSGAVSAKESGGNTGTSGIATATLVVLAPPAISKTFSSNPILEGGISTLTFTITNPNQNNALSGVSFSDTFPTSPAAMVVASTPNAITDNCGTPTFSPAASAASITFSGGSIAAGGTCTVKVDVTAPTQGDYVNTSSAVTHTLNAANWGSDTASATLTVTPVHPSISLIKQVAKTNVAPILWSSFVPVNLNTDRVWFRFIVENTGDVPLTSVSVSDPATYINIALCSWVTASGNPLTSPFALPVADINDDDHIAICVLDGPNPAATVVGTFVNTATATGSYVPTATTKSASDTATYATAALTLDKVATESYFTALNDLLHYTFTVTNSGAAILSGPVLIFDDKSTDETCPPLTTIGNNNNQFDPAEKIDCTATYDVIAADMTAKQVVNTATAKAGTVAGLGGTTSNGDSATVLLAADLAASKSNNTAGEIMAGGTFTWTLTVRNDVNAGHALFAQNDVILLDNLPNSGASYSLTPTAVVKSGITGDLDCSISTEDLTCTAGVGGVTIPSNLTGTVAVTNGSPTVTGTGTSFGTELSVGSILLIDNVPYTVLTVDSPTQVTLTTNYAGATASPLMIPASFSVKITVETLRDGLLTYPVSLANPRDPSGTGKCKADPDGKLTVEINAANNNCSDLVLSKVLPIIKVLKTVTPFSDSINGTTDPRAIPGAFMTYRLEIQNSGLGSVDSGTTILTDMIPGNAELFVGDLGGAGSGPVSFTDTCVAGTSPSGLSYTFTALDNTGDSLKFSKTAGVTYDALVAPADLPIVVDANQCDTAVTHFRLSLSGPFKGTLVSDDNKTTSFCLEYRVRLK